MAKRTKDSAAEERSNSDDEIVEATAVELDTDDSDTTDGSASVAAKHGFFTRLYTGTGAFEIVSRRKLWYLISGLIVAIAIASIVIKGFTFGIDFVGGTKVSIPRGDITVQQVEDVYREAMGRDTESVVIVGSGDSATVQIRSEALTNDETIKLKDALFKAFQPKGADGQPSPDAISDSAVSSTWGDQITEKALWGLGVFLVLAGLYITVRYERYMAIAALLCLGFDITVTAGIYSLVGFEVSPATVIGLLTILGFSLYDTVIVFDKVEENTHGFEHTTRRTFAEQANLAINQTFMRSINTSLISVIPVLALIVVAVWLLGVGTLKDLAIVQLVGIIVGTYSSIYFATPLLVSMRERTELVRVHTRRVMRRRKGTSAADDAPVDEAESPDSADEPVSVLAGTGGQERSDSGGRTGGQERSDSGGRTAPSGTPTEIADKPKPGARPIRPTRPSGKRATRRT